jgi:hypothetical protein
MRDYPSSEAPIYDSLIREHGNIPEEVRKVAERTVAAANAAVDFSALHARQDTMPVRLPRTA